MNFILVLLFLLVGSVILGLIRKFSGGTFLPQPGPDEDHLLMDKRGRWWRRDEQTGVLEEAMRRPSRETRSALPRFILSYLKLLFWIAVIGFGVAALGFVIKSIQRWLA